MSACESNSKIIKDFNPNELKRNIETSAARKIYLFFLGFANIGCVPSGYVID